MKKITMSLALTLVSMNAFAQGTQDQTAQQNQQQTTAQENAVPTLPPAATSPASQAIEAAGSTTAPLEAQQQASARKWKARILYEGSAAHTDATRNGMGAQIDSTDQVSVGYKITPETTVTAAQEFQYSHLQRSTDDNKIKVGVNTVQMLQPSLGIASSFDGILGSEKLSPSLRYYIPVSYDRRSRDSGTQGTLRGDVVPTWAITPSDSVWYLASPRITFAPQDNVWTTVTRTNLYVQPTARMVHGVGYTRSFGDTLSVDLYSYLDQMFDYNNKLNFSKARRMNSADKTDFTVSNDNLARNDFYIGTGMTWAKKLGDVTFSLNPYIEKTAPLSATYRILADPSSDGSKTFEEFFNYQDNMSYNLLLSVAL